MDEDGLFLSFHCIPSTSFRFFGFTGWGYWLRQGQVVLAPLTVVFSALQHASVAALHRHPAIDLALKALQWGFSLGWSPVTIPFSSSPTNSSSGGDDDFAGHSNKHYRHDIYLHKILQAFSSGGADFFFHQIIYGCNNLLEAKYSSKLSPSIYFIKSRWLGAFPSWSDTISCIRFFMSGQIRLGWAVHFDGNQKGCIKQSMTATMLEFNSQSFFRLLGSFTQTQHSYSRAKQCSIFIP